MDWRHPLAQLILGGSRIGATSATRIQEAPSPTSPPRKLGYQAAVFQPLRVLFPAKIGDMAVQLLQRAAHEAYLAPGGAISVMGEQFPPSLSQ